ncbi:MAG: class I SAM-dependent methyltransferase [Cyanobacteria bacterium P01_G01_bin.38]
MTVVSDRQDTQRYLPVLGDISFKTPLAYQVTRGAISIFNALQMAIAESYINGLEVPDPLLKSFFYHGMSLIFKYTPALLVPYEWVLKETDPIAEGAQHLMKVQYDLPQEMFDIMLEHSKRLYPKYSMGLWEKGATNLAQAQIDMLDDMIDKTGIQDGDDILDIGCGWGAAVNHILTRFPNSTCTGLSLSHEQCEWIRHYKMQDPNSSLSTDRFTLHEGDFNDAGFDKKFDKIISMGVFCHVGNLTKAFEKLATFLKDDGKVFIHIITVRTPNHVSSVFTHRYIFPHGRYWNHDAVPTHNRHLKTIKRWYLNGSNYSRTFANWLRNFDENQDICKTLDYGMDYAKFRRMWRFYLMWLGTSFASSNGDYNGNGQYLLVHA